MTETKEKNNVSLEGNIQPMEREEAEEHLKKLEGWQLSADGKKIWRERGFKNFSEAADFIVSLAGFAEKTNHYPDVVVIRRNRVRIELTGRKVGGLSEKDFVLAAEIDAIAGWKKNLEQWLASPKVFTVLLIILLLIILWQHFK